ncbi:hypothetical protein [uncultured Celeribacter sp.]|uniref:hypothetical protein n=1 Tax=uncultured Celeribacter sp. TaxID=1303376 RepID=UPI002AA8F38A|nr:hypothetical protein [uncultured Celeribacter sp.]
MTQKPSVVQILKSVPKVLTTDTMQNEVTNRTFPLGIHSIAQFSDPELRQRHGLRHKESAAKIVTTFEMSIINNGYYRIR